MELPTSSSKPAAPGTSRMSARLGIERILPSSRRRVRSRMQEAEAPGEASDSPPRTMRIRVPGLRRRFAWSVADQGISSLSNFVLGILVARSLGPEALGAFALAY